MAKKTAREANKRAAKRYKDEGRYEKNRKRRLEKHIKNHEQDEQAKEALKKPIEYRRKKPVKRLNATQRIYNKLLAQANSGTEYPEIGDPEWKKLLQTLVTRPAVKRRRKRSKNFSNTAKDGTT